MTCSYLLLKLWGVAAIALAEEKAKKANGENEELRKLAALKQNAGKMKDEYVGTSSSLPNEFFSNLKSLLSECALLRKANAPKKVVDSVYQECFVPLIQVAVQQHCKVDLSALLDLCSLQMADGKEPPSCPEWPIMALMDSAQAAAGSKEKTLLCILRRQGA